MSIILFVLAIPVSSREWKSRRIRVKATAYCPCVICCGKYANGKTAIGRDAYKPGIAVDPRNIRLRSYLDIPGYSRSDTNGSWVMADDTGSAILGNHIDIRFKSHKKAVEFGVKYITIRVWE